MTDEKGYIQFACEWTPAPPPTYAFAEELLACRNRLFARGLIGVYPNGIGFGNVSTRLGTLPFLITGTATGSIATLQRQHLTHVLRYDIAGNRLWCAGPLQASSESLSHAAVYETAGANVVIHVHHLGLWESLCGRIATTAAHAEAGTPAMADAIAELFASPTPPRGIFAMGGHREGIMSFGHDFPSAEKVLLDALTEYESRTFSPKIR